MLVSGDYYFYNFLNSKVKLTEMGLQILESIKGDKQLNVNIPREVNSKDDNNLSFSSYPD